MSRFTLRICFPAGGPLIGGYNAVGPGLHAAHAQRPRGLDRSSNDREPYLPAAALRGALRETLEALLRGTGKPACSRGDGVDPCEPRADETAPLPRSCTLHDGGPCITCLLFGTRQEGLRPGERAFSALILGDAAPVAPMSWTVRPGVSVDRPTRSTADKRLFFQQVPAAATGRPLVFVAEGRLVDLAYRAEFEAAVHATTHVGAGRSRGMAHVEMSVDWHTDKPLSETAASLPGEGDVLVRVTLTAPALVGTAIVDQNFRETRHEIPGSALRGAVGFTLAELLGDDTGHDPGMTALVGNDEQDGAHFGFLYPTDGNRPGISSGPIGPLPITALACKHAGRKHGLRDSLIDRLVLLHANSATEAERVAKPSTCAAHDCDAPLRTARGSRHATGDPPMRVITRVSIDRTRSSAADGELFTQILLDRGATLHGTIRNIPPAGRERLAQAAASKRMSFGRGRSLGWGRAEIEIDAAHVVAPIDERARAFDQALTRRLGDAGLSVARVGSLVPITLLAPLWPPADTNGEHLLENFLEAPSYFLKARRFVRDGAWDQQRGAMQPCWAIAAGAVFVVDLDGRHWRDVLERLHALERDGIGERCHQGYGHIICFDPYFVEKGV